MPPTTGTRRRGRPSGATTGELLAIARRAFLADGFAGTTMERVARQAGVSKASLYRSFPSKDDLLRAVVSAWVDAGADAMRPHVRALVEADDVRAGLLTLTRVMQAGILSRDVLAMRALVMSEAPRHPEIASHYLHSSWDRNVGSLAGALEQLDAIDVPDPYTAAEQLTWLAVGASLNRLDLTRGGDVPDPDRLERIAEAAVDTFLRTYARRAQGAR